MNEAHDNDHGAVVKLVVCAHFSEIFELNFDSFRNVENLL